WRPRASSGPCNRTARAKCSRRRRRRIEESPLKGLVLMLAIATQSVAPTIASEAQAGSGYLNAFLDEVRTLRADFTQTVTDAQGLELQQVEGTLAVKRPNRFRWDYRDQVIVADGERIWMYDE